MESLVEFLGELKEGRTWHKHPEVDMRIGIKENAWWNFMRNGVNGEHHWVYHLGKLRVIGLHTQPSFSSSR